MVATPDQDHQLGLERRPFVHHLPVARPDRDISPHRSAPVARTVALEVVKLLAIEFEDESISDQDVDAADTRNPHLGPQADSQPPKPQPGERLESRLAACIEQGNHPAHTGICVEAQFRERDQPQVQGRIQCGDGVLQRKAVRSAPDRIKHGIDRRNDRMVAPVRADTVCARGGRSSPYADMECATIDHPDAAQPQSRHATYGPARSDRRHEVGMRRAHQVPAGSRSRHLTPGGGTLYSVGRDALCRQAADVTKSAVAADGIGNSG